MAPRGEEMRRVEEALWNTEAASDVAALQPGAAGDAAESQPKAAPAASQPSAQPAAGQQEAGANRKRRASSFGGAVSPADLSPDSIMREISRLGAVIQRAVRPRSDGGRPMQVLVRLALHESAMRDGFVQRELSQAELAELVGIRPQSIGPILVKLEEEGLIERRPSQADRRSHLLALTDEGCAAAAKARELQAAYAEKALSVLTDEERIAFASAVVKLNDALK